MNKIKNALTMVMPTNRLQSNLAIAFSIFALFFAVGSSNVPCLHADTCAVGSEETFSGTLSIQNGTNYNLELTGIPTANRVLTLPDSTGTIALTSDIPVSPTLTPSKILSSSALGIVETTDKYPFTLGSIGQFLKVSASGLTMDFVSITGVPTLTSSKSVSTDGAGALTTNDVYPLTLTASKSLSTDGLGNVETNDVYPLTLTSSKVAKTDVSGNLTTGQIDVTTDVIAGASLQQIRTNAGGTALEYFTPSGGGDYTLLDSGAITNPTGNSDEFLICWGGGTLDATKTYKLIIWGGDGNHGNGTYYPYLRPGKNDCTTGTRTEWDSSANGNYGSSFVGRILDNSTSRSQDVDLCPLLQGTNANSSATYSLNVGGELNLRANGSQLTYQTDRGIRIQGEMMGEVMQTGGYNGGLQRGDIFCNWNNDLLFSDITHFYGNLNVDNMGTNTTHNAEWALYETGSQ